jgi:hypothetical protein
MQDYSQTTCGWYSLIPADGEGMQEAIVRMLYENGACTCPSCCCSGTLLTRTFLLSLCLLCMRGTGLAQEQLVITFENGPPLQPPGTET